MDRDVKRAKGADEQPIATKQDPILEDSKIEQLEEELRQRDAIIERLTRENEDLQQKLKTLQRGPVKKGAQTRYWRKEEHERFLEALEKYGQRDVKNISAYVGTRSPTQVRTHAQKYFLKQRREETAQMKSANSLARKRRLTMTTATTNPDEDEEDEEAEEDDEEDEEDDEDVEESGDGAKSSSAMQVDGVDGTDADGMPLRRKSTRVTNAAAVIKLRTQDLMAHTQASSMGVRGSAGKRTGASNGESSANGYSGASMGVERASALTSSGHSTAMGSGMNSSGTGGKSKADTSQTVRDRERKVSSGHSSATSSVSTSNAGKLYAASYAAGAMGPVRGVGGAQQAARAGNFSNSSSTTTLSSSSPSPYGTHGAYGAPTYPPNVAYPTFRTDIFSSAEEATAFYKAVKTYERETDRTKVLRMMKDYFLPHRSIEEISTMVDMAFPTVMDPMASYNAAAAAAAAFHPMYAQGRMYYPDASQAGPLAGFGGAQLAGQAHGASLAHHTSKVGLSGNPYEFGYSAGSMAAAGFGADGDASGADFNSAPTHIESSSLAFVSDRMSEHMKSDPNAARNPTTRAIHGQNTNVSHTSGVGPSISIHPDRPSSQHTPSPSASASMPTTAPIGHASAPKSGGNQTATNTAPATSGASTTAPTNNHNSEDEDTSLMSELVSLTDRAAPTITTDSAQPQGGLSSFVGGRPLALSPNVFGSTGTTPLGFGMTPLMANSTPLGFMSPLALNFASTQSPINPFFPGASHK